MLGVREDENEQRGENQTMDAVCVDNKAVDANDTIDINKRQQITLSTAIEISVDTIIKQDIQPYRSTKSLIERGDAYFE